MINPEKTIGQIEDGSPAQISAELPDLATLLFGSNFEACVWALKYASFNEMEYSDSALEVHVLSTPVAYTSYRPTHQHTQTHKPFMDC